MGKKKPGTNDKIVGVWKYIVSQVKVENFERDVGRGDAPKGAKRGAPVRNPQLKESKE